MGKIQNLKKRLVKKEKIILDGALGTEIQKRGISTTLPLWSAEALFTKPNIIKEIYIDYIKNGADVITTNTFRTTARVFGKVGKEKDTKKSLLLACKLAQEAVTQFPDKEIYIAGSVAPLEDCYSPELTPPRKELEKEHLEYVSQLKEGGVDFILVETMITIRETLAVLKAAQKIKIPVAVSFCIDKNGNLLSGESLEEAVDVVKKYNPLFISVNCVQPDIATLGVKKLKELTDLPIGVYANGDGKAEDTQGWEFIGNNLVQKYKNHANIWQKNGAQIIGGCCGTSPEYIHALTQ